jgi:DNA-binding LacI/PurR family transcriptional regulator
MGVRAAKMLLDRIETGPGEESRKVLLEPWLVVRESTAPARG